MTGVQTCALPIFVVNDSQARKQAGNAVPVNMVKAVILKLLPYVATTLDMTSVLREYEVNYGER